jgi:hypothetical protein
VNQAETTGFDWPSQTPTPTSRQAAFHSRGARSWNDISQRFSPRKGDLDDITAID